MYHITDRIGCVLTGIKRTRRVLCCRSERACVALTLLVWARRRRCAADGLQLLSKARRMAAEFSYDFGYDIPVHYLAKKIADNNQVCACGGVGHPLSDEA
jgi:20S proteasome subunit alpha 1